MRLDGREVYFDLIDRNRHERSLLLLSQRVERALTRDRTVSYHGTILVLLQLS